MILLSPPRWLFAIVVLAAASLVPVLAGDRLTAGNSHSCAIRSDGTLACWGDDAYGETSLIPPGAFAQVSAGETHSCALNIAGGIQCWGGTWVP
jgi:alpha-tubulin suppressor-like RCC1 family protein